MRPSHPWRVLVGALLVVAALGVGGTALAAGGNGPAKARIQIKGNASIVPNVDLKISFHFSPGVVPIRSGGTITLTNLTGDGHSLSIVKGSQVPRTVQQVENCMTCGEIAKAHGINFEGPPMMGPPPHIVVNAGAEGFNTPGDSVVIGPKGHPGAQTTFKVTAKPGTVLNFICIFHPWMQGKFKVTK